MTLFFPASGTVYALCWLVEYEKPESIGSIVDKNNRALNRGIPLFPNLQKRSRFQSESNIG